jgi:predicted NBD/HSP70 family sugar kinase
MKAAIGIDLGGNKINLTVLQDGRFLIDDMFEFPSLVDEGPGPCIDQMLMGYREVLKETGLTEDEVAAVGLDSPGPASAKGVMGATGPTNFKHPAWGKYDIRGGLEEKIGKPVIYLNDGNAAALYAHYHKFGSDLTKSSVSLIIGTGLGGGIVVNGRVIVGRVGFAAELGHTCLPGTWNPDGWFPTKCQCGRVGDLESVVSLTGIELNHLPRLLPLYADHPLHQFPVKAAAKQVRGMAQEGDPMCTEIFRLQTLALGAHIDQMINVLDMDAVFIGGGGIQFDKEFQDWYLAKIRESVPWREEQKDLPIEIAAGQDTAGARGSAVHAAQSGGV